MSYQALAAHCNEYGIAKGFSPSTFDDLPTRLMAIDAEIRELRKAIEADDVSAMEAESADVASYALSTLHQLGYADWAHRERMHADAHPRRSPSEIVEPLREYVAMAWEYWRLDNRKEAMQSIEILVHQLVDIRKRVLGLPNALADDVHRKLAKNASRPPCHGKNPRS